MASSTVSSLLFFLLLVFSLYMDEALGAHTEIRKLKETIKMRRNLKGNAYRSSKMEAPVSVSKHCQSRSYPEIVPTYLPNEYSCPYIQCDANSVCSSCIKIRRCVSINGSPQGCDVTETCCLINNTKNYQMQN